MKLERITFFALISFICSCGTIATPQYDEHLRVVKSVAVPGKSVYLVKSDLEKKGYEVSDPYDPTKLGKVLWMNVRWGASPGVVDGVLYASGFPDKGPPTSIVVKADYNGAIVGVK